MNFCIKIKARLERFIQINVNFTNYVTLINFPLKINAMKIKL